MANPWRGEVRLVLNGEPHELRLTLGALAELEDSLPDPNVIGLIERLEQGAFSTRDVLSLIVAGLRGGGWRGTAKDLLSAEIEGGPVEAARVAGLLLSRAFALPNETDGSV